MNVRKNIIDWNNLEEVKEYHKKYHRDNETINTRRRKEIIKRLGDKCKKCGFLDYRALQIDHINGGGGKQIKDKFNNRRSIYHKYLINLPIRELKKDYQCLCANCNWIKRAEKREYGTRY